MNTHRVATGSLALSPCVFRPIIWNREKERKRCQGGHPRCPPYLQDSPAILLGSTSHECVPTPKRPHTTHKECHHIIGTEIPYQASYNGALRVFFPIIGCEIPSEIPHQGGRPRRAKSLLPYRQDSPAISLRCHTKEVACSAQRVAAPCLDLEMPVHQRRDISL